MHILALIHIAHWKYSGRSLSPLEPSEAQQTLELGYINAGFVLLVILVFATLIVGRFFCGWACHVVAYQDASAWLLGRLGLRPRPVRSRCLMALPFLAAFDMFALPSLQRWMEGGSLPSMQLQLSSSELWATFPGPEIAVLTILVDGFILVWFLGAKGFCTYGCPYGAIFGLAERASPGRIRVTDACEGCGHCTATCTSNVQVHAEVARHGEVIDPGCMRCMDCVSVCPKQALYFGFKSKIPPRAKAPRRTQRSWDFSLKEEFALGAVALLGVFAFRGLYHRIPFMLSLGLGVLLAASVLTLVRMFRSSEMQLQHFSIRRAGKWTRAGMFMCLGLFSFVGLGVHSLAMRAATLRGAQLIDRADALPAAEREPLLEQASKALFMANQFGFLPDPEVSYLLGLIELASGRYARAQAMLRRATSQAPDMRSPHLALAEASLKLGDLGQAGLSLGALLKLDPTHVRGRWRFAQWHIMMRQYLAAERILESLLKQVPEHHQAFRDLERVRQVLGH